MNISEFNWLLLVDNYNVFWFLFCDFFVLLFCLKLFFITILLLYWGYIVTFTNILTIYHTWIHSLRPSLPLFPPFLEQFKQVSFLHFYTWIHNNSSKFTLLHLKKVLQLIHHVWILQLIHHAGILCTSESNCVRQIFFTRDCQIIKYVYF
jgi:hypothetical protein